MKRILRFLIAILMIITLKGCNESRVLEENTKEVGLSNYKVSYKYLNADYFEEGYLFEPLYFKDDELYGITKFYPMQGPVEVEDNLLYKIDKNGNFKEYENEIIRSYLEDPQIRTNIKDKNIYIRSLHTQDINYYYSDFENDIIKDFSWIEPYMKEIKEKKESIRLEIGSEFEYENIFKNDEGNLYEVNTNIFYEEDYKDINNQIDSDYKENYKFIYYIDINEEEVFISDVYKEEPSVAYYYNEKEEAFIKLNKNGSYEKLEFSKGKIRLKDYKVNNNFNLKEIFEKAKSIIGLHFYNEERLKDYTVIRYSDEKALYKYIIINNSTNEVNNYGEEYMLDDRYVYIEKVIPNSNYFLTKDREDNNYIGVLNEKLELELIGNIDLKLNTYSKEYGEPNINIFSNDKGNKALITVKSFNYGSKKYAYSDIQYIYLDIEERD